MPQTCKNIGCEMAFANPNSDYCAMCMEQFADQFTKNQLNQMDDHSVISPEKDTSSGGNNDYWVAIITAPKRLDPYQAECEDLIELFQMSFAEGNAFKALWRMGMARVSQGKPGDSPLRNAEKVAYYGERMVVREQRELA